MSISLPEYFFLLSSLVMSFVFLYSSISKVKNVGAFATAVGEFDLIPPTFNTAAAYIFIVMECSVPLLELVQPRSPLGGLLALLLLGLFTLAIAATLIRKRQISCHCFGQPTSEMNSVTLLRNAVLTIIALDVAVQAGRPPGQHIGMTLALAIVPALVTTLIITHAEMIAAAFRVAKPPRPSVAWSVTR